jgi:hypothetical protein
MYASLRLFAILALVTACVIPALAQEGQKKKKKGPQQAQAISAMMKKVESLGLSEEQTAKIKKIGEEMAPKFNELNQKLNTVLTPEQKKARQEAVAKNKADGKKGKEANEAIDAALALTDEQKKVQADVQASMKELSGKLNAAVLEVLTAEQKAKFQPAKKGKKAKDA